MKGPLPGRSPEVMMGRLKALDEIKAEVRDHTGKKKIFRRAKKEDVQSVLANLTSKDPELWAAEWSRVAKPYEDAGAQHEQPGRCNEGRAAYLQAYTSYATGGYPVPHTPVKIRCAGDLADNHPWVKSWAWTNLTLSTAHGRLGCS